MSGARAEIAAFLALLALAALTFGLAYAPMGPGNAVAAVGIAVLKALLVAAVFMHLGARGALLRLTALVGALFLAVMFLLTFADLLTRPG